MVLGSHLDTDLQILTDVCWKHGPEAFHWIFYWQWAKVVHEPLEEGENTFLNLMHVLPLAMLHWYKTKSILVDPVSTKAYLWVEKMCVHHSTLDVIQICVVLQRPLKESSLLTQLGNVGTIIVGEHLVAQDSISNLQPKQKHQINNPPSFTDFDLTKHMKTGLPVGHAWGSSPRDESVVGPLRVCCSLEHQGGKTCTAGSGCTPWTHPQSEGGRTQRWLVETSNRN